MVKGKLTELEREPLNVQVLMSSSGMLLLDEGEQFMSIPAELDDEEPREDLVESEDEGSDHYGSIDETEQLRTKLLEARAEIEQLLPHWRLRWRKGKIMLSNNCGAQTASIQLTELDNNVSSWDA